MKQAIFLPFLFSLPLSLWGVYAPIPSQDLGKVITVDLSTGIHFDSNVLGTPDDEIDSAVFTVAPEITYQASLAEQTFLNASYKLTSFFYSDRPSDDTLFNNEFSVRLSHQFSEILELNITENYSLIDSPESILNGIVQSTDQSVDQNFFNLDLEGNLTKLISFGFNFRNLDFSYDDEGVAIPLDRNDSRFGFKLGYGLQPETTGIFEYRYQDISYDTDGDLKDSESNFYLFGVDYQPSPTFLISARAGFEDRDRSFGTGDTNGYGELTVLYRYAQNSFISSGIVFSTEETSNPINFSDEETFAIFGNIQHAINSSLYLSGSIYYDNADLQAQSAPENVTDNTVRFGVSVTYEPSPKWSIIFSYDLDNTTSDDFFREENRSRVGITARYTFGL